MPDVTTHLLVGAALALLLRKDGPRSEQMLVIIGAVIIDAERPFSWLLRGTALEWVDLVSGFHSILGAVALAYVTAAFIAVDGTTTRSRFALVLIGCASHLIMDMMMYPWAELGIYVLYPLKVAFSFHLLWPDFAFYPLIGLAIFGLVALYRYPTIRQAILNARRGTQASSQTGP